MGVARLDCLFRSTTSPRERWSEPNENIWIVPLSEMTAIISSKGCNTALAETGGGAGENAMEWILARSTPRRNSTRQAQDRVSHNRRRVPWTDVDARSVPE